MKDRRIGGFDWMAMLTKVGLPTLLVLYLLGAIPWMKSPIDRIEGALASHDKSTQEQTAALVRILRTICRYQVPRDLQAQCDD